MTKKRAFSMKHHRPGALWFTGLSGSGKSTIANLVETRLYGMGIHTICSTAIMFGTGSIRILDLPSLIGSKTFVALAKSPN